MNFHNEPKFNNTDISTNENYDKGEESDFTENVYDSFRVYKDIGEATGINCDEYVLDVDLSGC